MSVPATVGKSTLVLLAKQLCSRLVCQHVSERTVTASAVWPMLMMYPHMIGQSESSPRFAHNHAFASAVDRMGRTNSGSDIAVNNHTESNKWRTSAPLTEGEFHRQADATLDFLQEKLDVYLEDLDLDNTDIEYGQGVLTVKLGKFGTYVINKQTPNRQIWMSSPVSGPVRYDWVPGQGVAGLHGKWVYHRDGHDIITRLEQEITQLVGESPELLK